MLQEKEKPISWIVLKLFEDSDFGEKNKYFIRKTKIDSMSGETGNEIDTKII